MVQPNPTTPNSVQPLPSGALPTDAENVPIPPPYFNQISGRGYAYEYNSHFGEASLSDPKVPGGPVPVHGGGPGGTGNVTLQPGQVLVIGLGQTYANQSLNPDGSIHLVIYDKDNKKIYDSNDPEDHALTNDGPIVLDLPGPVHLTIPQNTQGQTGISGFSASDNQGRTVQSRVQNQTANGAQQNQPGQATPQGQPPTVVFQPLPNPYAIENDREPLYPEVPQATRHYRVRPTDHGPELVPYDPKNPNTWTG